MKRISTLCLLIGLVSLECLVTESEAYLVHEEPEENDETARGKRQENGGAVIDSIFNIPIQAIKSTSVAAQSWSPQNAGTIDSVLKIPITTLQAVSQLIKNRQQNRYQETTPLSATPRPTRRPQRRYDNPTTTISSEDRQRLREEAKRLAEAERERQREVIRRRVEAQREQQRLYMEQLHRRRFAQLEEYNHRMQQQILNEDQRTHHKFYRDPFGFNALTKWIVGNNPQHTFNGHAGHGDGHVYQHYSEQRPLHFGHHQGTHRPIPTKPTPPLSSTTAGAITSSSTSSSTTSTSTASSSTGIPSHQYQVFEIVDEGANPFTWPNWLGVINSLANTSPQTFSKKQKIQFDEPLQNKIAPKDNAYYKIKYAEARKKAALQHEITGNEIDGDVASAEARITPAEREGKVVFPSK